MRSNFPDKHLRDTRRSFLWISNGVTCYPSTARYSVSKSQHRYFDKHAYLSYRWRCTDGSANGTERARKREIARARTRRSKRAISIFPICLCSALLRRRYISSRRKKFNVAVKADGNADCGLRASPVTALHRMVHISRVHRPLASSSATAHWPSPRSPFRGFLAD